MGVHDMTRGPSSAVNDTWPRGQAFARSRLDRGSFDHLLFAVKAARPTFAVLLAPNVAPNAMSARHLSLSTNLSVADVTVSR